MLLDDERIDPNLSTPFSTAVQLKKFEFAQQLLDCKRVNPNIPDAEGVSN